MDTKALALEVSKFTAQALFSVEALYEDGQKFKADQLLRHVRDLNHTLSKILESNP